MGDKTEPLFNPTFVPFRDYTESIRISGQYAKPLVRELMLAKPTDADDAETQHLERLAAIALEIDDVRTERTNVVAVRPALNTFSACWGGAYDTLLGISRMPVSMGSRGPRAERLLARLFPSGSGFLKLDARAAWSEADRVLRVIETESLGSELVELLGGEYTTAMKKSAQELSDAGGFGRVVRETPSTTAMQETLLRFWRALGAYGRILAAKVDENDPASVRRFLDAVAPIDRYRDARSKGAGPEPVEPTGDEPAAPVPAAGT